jgi:hypothetical protein
VHTADGLRKEGEGGKGEVRSVWVMGNMTAEAWEGLQVQM